MFNPNEEIQIIGYNIDGEISPYDRFEIETN